MRGIPSLVILYGLFLCATTVHAQAPSANELPPVAPASSGMEANSLLPPPTAATPGSDIRLVQGSANPNSNLRPDDVVRQGMQPGVDLECRPLLKTWATAFTFLPSGSGSHGFGVESIEGSATFQIPFLDGHAPLLVRPGAGIHFWQQPTFGQPLYTFGMPKTVYDLYVDVGWQPRVADWLVLDLGITPGIYTDFNNTGDEAFRLRGRAVGIFCYSEEFQIVAGTAALNRDRFNWIPVFGVLWNPSPEWRVNLVFPESKISYLAKRDGSREWWVYVSSELGGGVWAVQRGGVLNDSVEYDDWRINLGVEWKSQYGVSGLVEVGYVFSRELFFQRPDFVFNVNNTVMLRVGLIF